MTLLICLMLSIFALQLYSQSSDAELISIGERHMMHSQILNEERELQIYTPAGFWGMDDSTAHYPVIYVLDGESQFLNAVSMVDFLSSAPMGNDLMPRSIVVGIPNVNRNRDLTPSIDTSLHIGMTGGGSLFLDFITAELVPYMDSLYSTTGHRTIIGHSFGGLTALQALLEKRDYFDHYLSIDPALSYHQESFMEQLLDTLREADLSQEGLYLSVSNSLPPSISPDAIQNDSSEIVEMRRSAMKFIDHAEAEDWNIKFAYQDYLKEDHFSVPVLSTYDGLKYFYADYPFKEILDYYHPSFQDRYDLVDRLKDHYATISAQLGFEVKPMISYLNSWAYGISHFGRDDLAVALFDYGIELYPNHASVLNNKAFYLNDRGQMEEALELFQKSLSISYDEGIASVIEGLESK